MGTTFQTTAAGSGGPSNYSSQPSWQTSVVGLPTASGGPRYLPDVSLFAANGLWAHFFVYCMTDAAEGGATCDYTNSTDVNDLAAGGTSFSTPIMAGIMALIDQNTGTSQGNPNPRLYQMASAEYGTTGSQMASAEYGTMGSICNSSLSTAVDKSCVFYDVTKGDIDVNCTGTTNCFGYSSGSSAIDGVLSTSSTTLGPAYPAGTGWDYATGLGTINAANLVNGWVAAASTTTLTSGASTSAIGTSVTFTATVTTSNGINISGSVSWSSNTGCATSFIPVPTAASAVVTCTTSSLPSGAVTVTGTYSGDATHVTSPGSFQEQVTVAPTVSFTGAPASAAYQATFSVSSHTNASTTASYLATGACSISGTTVTMISPTGTCSLTASWAADTNYNSATATQSTTALKANPTVTFTGAPATAAYQATFSVSSHTNATTTASYQATGACSISGTTVTMTSGIGTCSLTASWAADTNYTSTSATQSTSAVKLTPTVSWSTPASIVYGSALGNGQLNATASVAGTFVYVPGPGTVLPIGTGDTLAVSFTPSDANDYNTATGSTTINVTTPATTPVNLVVTGTTTRNGTILVQVIVANSGGASAANVVLTSVKVGATAATTLPQSLGALAPGNSARATVSVPGSVGVSGAASTLSMSGTYTGGTFTTTARVTLP